MFKFIKRLIISVILIVGIAGGTIVYQGYDMYKTAIEEMSIKEKIEEIKEESNVYTKFEDLPKEYINAVIAVEDRRFFEH